MLSQINKQVNNRERHWPVCFVLKLLAVQGLKEQDMDWNLFKERPSPGAALWARPSSETESSWGLWL